jgi:hypothetical protein
MVFNEKVCQADFGFKERGKSLFSLAPLAIYYKLYYIITVSISVYGR